MAPVNSSRKILSSVSRLLYNKYCENRLTLQKIYRPLSTAANVDGDCEFEDTIRRRKNEAYRSIVIEIAPHQNANSLLRRKDISAKTAYLYKVMHEREFLLLEFNSESDLAAFTKRVAFADCSECIPVHSRFITYLTDHQSNKNNHTGSKINIIEYSQPDNRQIINILKSAKNISSQMVDLYEECKLPDLQSRLRFLVCTQLEQSLSSLFPRSCVYPFGSSVNGFGQFNCDLDMALRLDDSNSNSSFQEKSFIFRSKATLPNSRSQSQRDLEVIGDVVDVFLPGCVNVQRILQARVPIIKFHHSYTDVDCDFTTCNMSGVYMSKLLCHYANSDFRVRPLVFTVLKWAKVAKLTQSAPGQCVTNFQLTLMVIFYLQQRKIPILLPANSFTREYQVSGKKSELPDTKKEELSDLLVGFFTYYHSFDFKEKGISVVTGNTINKRDHCSLYIENAIDRELNVARNVNSLHLNKFVDSCRIALWCLDQNTTRADNRQWGILNLFDWQPQHDVGFRVHSLFPSTKSSSVDVLLDNFTNKNSAATKRRKKNKNIKLTRNW